MAAPCSGSSPSRGRIERPPISSRRRKRIHARNRPSSPLGRCGRGYGQPRSTRRFSTTSSGIRARVRGHDPPPSQVTMEEWKGTGSTSAFHQFSSADRRQAGAGNEVDFRPGSTPSRHSHGSRVFRLAGHGGQSRSRRNSVDVSFFATSGTHCAHQPLRDVVRHGGNNAFQLTEVAVKTLFLRRRYGGMISASSEVVREMSDRLFEGGGAAFSQVTISANGIIPHARTIMGG